MYKLCPKLNSKAFSSFGQNSPTQAGSCFEHHRSVSVTLERFAGGNAGGPRPYNDDVVFLLWHVFTSCVIRPLMNSRFAHLQSILTASQVDSKILEMPSSTRTAKEAAAAIGCSVSQIVKSLVFRMTNSGNPLLVLTSGTNRVNEAKVGEDIGELIGKADPEFVRLHTGYAIGGVSPIGHPNPLRTLIDIDLFQYEVLWAAAGDPFHVFSMTPDQLEKLTSGKRMVVT